VANPKPSRRAEIGAARRERTRETLIAGALETLSSASVDELTIDDFVAAAGVARGTYYNHFRTKVALLNAMADYVAERIVARLDETLAGEEDPVRRIAIAAQTFVRIATEEPAWGWVLVRSTPEMVGGWSDGMRAGVIADLRRGQERGIFHVLSEDAAVAMTIGSLREGIRLALTSDLPPDFGIRLAQMTLLSLGTAPADVARAEAFRL
jgi:AcrR family transcriptional regulator